MSNIPIKTIEFSSTSLSKVYLLSSLRSHLDLKHTTFKVIILKRKNQFIHTKSDRRRYFLMKKKKSNLYLHECRYEDVLMYNIFKWRYKLHAENVHYNRWIKTFAQWKCFKCEFTKHLIITNIVKLWHI